MLEPDTLPLGILTEESDKLKNVRMIRNNKIKKTDMYLLIDYPITDEKREEWKVYRQKLRDITTKIPSTDLEIVGIYYNDGREDEIMIKGIDWPGTQQIEQALEHIESSAKDENLKKLKMKLDSNGLLLQWQGQMANVYKATYNNEKFAIKILLR